MYVKYFYCIDKPWGCRVMKKRVLVRLHVVLISMGLMMLPPLFAKDPAESAQPQPKQAAAESVQKEVNKQSASKVSEKRRHIISEASAALNETRNALTALDDKMSTRPWLPWRKPPASWS